MWLHLLRGALLRESSVGEILLASLALAANLDVDARRGQPGGDRVEAAAGEGVANKNGVSARTKKRTTRASLLWCAGFKLRGCAAVFCFNPRLQTFAPAKPTQATESCVGHVPKNLRLCQHGSGRAFAGREFRGVVSRRNAPLARGLNGSGCIR